MNNEHPPILALQDVLNELKKVIGTAKFELTSQIADVQNSLKDTNSKLDSLTVKVADHDVRINKLESLNSEVANLKSQANAFVKDTTGALKTKDKAIETLHSRISSLELENRRNNLVIAGIPEKPDENRNSLAAEVTTLLSELIGWTGKLIPAQVYRRGSKSESPQPRRIVLKFDSAHSKSEIIKQAYQLKGSGIFISPDFTPSQDKARYYLRKFIREETNGRAKFISNFVIRLDDENLVFDESLNQMIKKD